MDTNKKSIAITATIILILLALGMWLVIKAVNVPGKYDKLAQCLKDKGATFYGAFWCPHCQKEKSWFGSSTKYLPYVECSNPDGHTQTQVCIDKKITGYPTWIFTDGSQLTGEVPLDQLAQKTSCEMPK